MQPSLLSLSNELLTLIAGASASTADLDPDTNLAHAAILGNLRLTCSRLSFAATPLLFRSITLCPASSSIDRWNALLDDDASAAARSFVRRAVFESEFERQDHCTMYAGGGEAVRTELTDEWRAAVARLGEWAHVDEVYIRFSPQCAVDDKCHEDYDQRRLYSDFRKSDTMKQRREILTTVFEAMAGLGEGRRVRSLSVENLQNVVDKRLAKKPCFGQVMTGLGELHVCVVCESDEAAPENAFALPSVVKFWPAFTDRQLLWRRAFWQGGGGGGGGGGAGTDYSPPPLVFPALGALALGNYVLAYESQLDWLASPTTFPRLERLMLDDCPMMSHLLVHTPRQLLSPVYPEKLHLLRPDPGAPAHQHKFMLASRLRWDVVFDRLREGLPSLGTFIFSSGDWRDGKAFSERDTNVSQFLTRRYLGYHDGIGPSPYVDPRADWKRVDEVPAKLIYGVYQREGYRDRIDDDDRGLAPPSNDPDIGKAELDAFNRLNEALAQRK